ncbi:MAG: tetratricopeptide repeat protein [Gemmatimonadota bacterium]
MAAYQAAVGLDSLDRAARTNLANLLYEQAASVSRAGDGADAQALLERAASEYRRVLSQDPEYREALANLGNVYLAMGRTAAAAAQYRRAVEVDPNFGDGFYNLGRLYLQEGQYPSAAPLLERAALLQPDLAEGHFALGSARALMGDLAGALGPFRQACRLAPGELAYLYNLAEVLLQLSAAAPAAGASTADLRREARSAYERVAAMDPGYRRVQERLQYLRRAGEVADP